MHYTSLVSPELVASHLEDEQWCIIDCSFSLANPTAGREEYQQGHIPGAYYAHLDEILSSPVKPGSGRHPLPEREQLASWLGETGVTSHTQVVVYDSSQGMMAARLWWLLRWLGHDKVALLDGGVQRWQSNGYPLSSEIPSSRSTAFVATQPREQTVDSDTLMAGITTQEQLIIDVRAPERFRGEVEPLDRIAGHIPKALNVPLQQNLDNAGNFLSPEQLRRIYSPLIAHHPIEQVAVMCGSGVTACHTILALRIAGLGGARLYAGSWSEWITDPHRPVATG